MSRLPLALPLAALCLAAATPQEDLRAAVEARFKGDRSGAVIAAALVGDATLTALVEADGKQPRKLDEHARFEIGPVSSALTAALVADLARKGELSLDDPLARFLPKGAKIPEFEGKPITLRHVLNQRSGLPTLPGRLKPADEANPYASLTPELLLGSLEDVKLEEAPGSRYHPSPFAMMLLSYAMAQRAGGDLEGLLAERIFKPLAMGDAHLRGPAIQGHASNGRPVPAWDFPPALAGMGGVRASLADMARFVEAELGRPPAPSPIAQALQDTQQPAADAPGPRTALPWSLLELRGRPILYQDGSTGGFSSAVALDPERHQGVVLLSDTNLANFGGLVPLALSILEPSLPSPGYPRHPSMPGELLMEGMVGRYLLPGDRKLILTRRSDHLIAHVEGQPDLDLAFDSAGDFYATDRDVLVRPIRTPRGYAFWLRQGGASVKVERLQVDPLDVDAVKVYIGKYEDPGKGEIKVFARGALLFVEGAGRPETAVEAVDKDVFASAGAAAEFTFTRDAGGKVTALVISQDGKTLTAPRR